MLPKKKHFFVAASEENQIVVAILQLYVDWIARINFLRKLFQKKHSLESTQELVFYLKEHNVNAVFIGHPLADSTQQKIDVKTARNNLKLSAKTVIALMPGSRGSEINRHAKLFFETAELITNRIEDIEFVVPVVDSKIGEQLKKILAMYFTDLKMTITDSTHSALSACDLVITKSGTSTLEAALHKKPMVVVYKMSQLSYWFLKISKMVHTDYSCGQRPTPLCNCCGTTCYA